MKIADEEIDNQTNNVNGFNFEKYKENFNIFIYVIPKEFLNHNPNGDPEYYQNEKYKEELYTFNDITKTWVLLDTFKINSTSENELEQNWRDNFIELQSKKINNNNIE